MGTQQAQTYQIQAHIDRLRALDPADRTERERARQELVDYACDRLKQVARSIVRGYPGLQRWEQTDDVFAKAMLRLWSSLQREDPVDARWFLGLAARIIRDELVNLIRHYYGPLGAGTHHATPGPELAENGRQAQTPHAVAERESEDPAQLAEWTEFHERVGQLPEEERMVFDLLWYHGLSQEQAAALLGVHVRTIKRRWRKARLRLHEWLFHQS